MFKDDFDVDYHINKAHYDKGKLVALPTRSEYERALITVGLRHVEGNLKYLNRIKALESIIKALKEDLKNSG